MAEVERLLVCEDLHKSYGERAAVDGVSFHIARGETYGLLGPNGAGKTTSISMVCGLMERNGGDITVGGLPMGIDTVDAKALIGYGNLNTLRTRAMVNMPVVDDALYMRVNWATNLLPGYYGQTSDLFAVLGFFERHSLEPHGRLGTAVEAEVPDCNQGSLRHENAPLHGVIQLSDIAGPRSAHQRPHCVAVHTQNSSSELAVDFVQQMLGEKWNVLRSITEGGELHFDDAESIVEIVPEPACSDLLFQVSVRSSDETDIDPDWITRTHWKNLTSIQSPEKLWLHLQGQFP